MRTYKIHLVRHGLTQANLDGLYCGSTDLPLCPEGMADLHRLAGEYAYPYVDIVYTSPMQRARQSANLLFPDYEHEIIDDFREAAFGIYEGRRFSELQKDENFKKWIAFGSDYLPEGAEPADEFQQRCVTAFVGIVDSLMKSGSMSAAIVTHAGVIANILAALAYPKKSAYDWQCVPGCGYTVLADPSLFLRSPVVEVVSYVPETLADD